MAVDDLTAIVDLRGDALHDRRRRETGRVDVRLLEVARGSGDRRAPPGVNPAGGPSGGDRPT